MAGRHRFETALLPAMRRVEGIRLIVGGDRTRAEVYGTGHRHPVTIPVSLALAARLVQAGAPLSVGVDRSSEGAVAVASR